MRSRNAATAFHLHIIKRSCVSLCLGRRNNILNRDAHAGVGTVSDHWRNVFGVDMNFLVKYCALICAQREPIFTGGIEITIFDLGRKFAALNPIKSNLVRGDHAAACARLDRHITNGHAALHAHLVKDIAAIFKRVARTAAHANLRDDI